MNGARPEVGEATPVVLVGMARSGTSFLGELFRQNREYSYLFEPFARTPLAAQEFCWKSESHVEGDPMVPVVQAVCSGDVGPLLPLDAKILEWLESRGYRRGARRPKVALKEIKVNLHLRWLHGALGGNVRILHIVRDPRGVVDSFQYAKRRPQEVGSSGASQTLREHWGWEEAPLEIRLHRQQELASLFGSASGVDDLAARWTVLVGHAIEASRVLPATVYHRIRYEDLCNAPVEVADRIFAWLGEPLPEEVRTWLRANTVGGDRSARYSTSRDSRSMASIWRERLSRRQQQRIGEIAGGVMEEAGYDPSVNPESSEVPSTVANS